MLQKDLARERAQHTETLLRLAHATDQLLMHAGSAPLSADPKPLATPAPWFPKSPRRPLRGE